jgi:hypothetical protein
MLFTPHRGKGLRGGGLVCRVPAVMLHGYIIGDERVKVKRVLHFFDDNLTFLRYGDDD